MVRELNYRLEECKNRELELDEREKRIAIAQATLTKEAVNLENLRIQLVMPLTRLQEAIAELERTRIVISKAEQAEIKKTAGIYEKMDATSGSQILAQMYTNNNEEHVVKILHQMSDRAAAKILAEMTDKNMAAKLCEKMKIIAQEG